MTAREYRGHANNLFDALGQKNTEISRLKARIAELEASVRNQQGDNLCWFDLATMSIPPQGDFLESCRRYHAQIAQTNGVLEGSRTIAQLEARVAELEAERDHLKEKSAHLYKLCEMPLISLSIAIEDRDKLKHSDRALRKENAALRQEIEMLSGNPEAVHQGALAALSAIKQMTKMKAELEAERDLLKDEAACANEASQFYNRKAADSRILLEYQEAENAALRKALDDAEHGEDCEINECGECTCWKARIAEAKP